MTDFRLTQTFNSSLGPKVGSDPGRLVRESLINTLVITKSVFPIAPDILIEGFRDRTKLDFFRGLSPFDESFLFSRWPLERVTFKIFAMKSQPASDHPRLSPALPPGEREPLGGYPRANPSSALSPPKCACSSCFIPSEEENLAFLGGLRRSLTYGLAMDRAKDGRQGGLSLIKAAWEGGGLSFAPSALNSIAQDRTSEELSRPSRRNDHLFFPARFESSLKGFAVLLFASRKLVFCSFHERGG
jgi:hypothetical protein